MDAGKTHKGKRVRNKWSFVLNVNILDNIETALILE